MLTPTGQQITLLAEHDGHTVTAQVAQVGASLRHLAVDGVSLVPPYPDNVPSPAASGVVLAPWPNRIRDGKYVDAGVDRQLAITEPALNNASHGLLRFTAYDITEGARAVTLRADIFPQTGYPHHLQTSVTYALSGLGIKVSHAIRNVGETTAPFALGTHPYLCLGDVPADQLTVTSSGSQFFEVDDRLLPTGIADVTPENDLRGGAKLSELHLDTAYTGLQRGSDGNITHTLADDAGRTVTLWQGEGFDFVQFYTSRSYPGRDVALACEPMTAPADAFNSGMGLRHLAPEEAVTYEWGITFTPSA